MSGAIPSLPNMPSWRGAQLQKEQGQLYYFFTFFVLRAASQACTFHYKDPSPESSLENCWAYRNKCKFHTERSSIIMTAYSAT
jgi:hypothetical protein